LRRRKRMAKAAVHAQSEGSIVEMEPDLKSML
jgi:hypothetical protein